MLRLKYGCVELLAILGIRVKQVTELWREKKAFSFPFLPLPAPVWPRVAAPRNSLRAGQRAKRELQAENSPSSIPGSRSGDEEGRGARETRPSFQGLPGRDAAGVPAGWSPQTAARLAPRPQLGQSQPSADVRARDLGPCVTQTPHACLPPESQRATRLP